MSAAGEQQRFGARTQGSAPAVRRIPRVRSLRTRAVLVVVLVLLCPPLFVTVSAIFEESVERRLGTRVEVAAHEALAELGPFASAAPPGAEVLARLARSLDAIAARHEVWLRVVDGDDRVIVDARHDRASNAIQRLGRLVFGEDGAPTLADFDAAQGALAARPEIASARARGRDAGCRTSPEGKLLVCHAALVPATSGRDASAALAIHAAKSARRSVRALYDLEYQLKKLMLLVLPVALALAWWLGRRMVRPIEELREQVLAQASAASPRAELHVARRDELQDLAAAFNALLATLESRNRANEAFSADLVHELKNPVAAIRTAAESLAAGPVDAERAGRLARVLSDSSARLDRVVTQFLELARAEGGMRDEPREPIDLAALVGALVERARGDERYADRRLTCSAPDPARVMGVAERLETALRNLLDNALDFAGPGGEVDVTIEMDASAVRVRVSDDGPGIPAEALPRVFERFFTTRGAKRGTGLGLAMVRAIAEAHGGGVRVDSSPERGTTFELTVPR
ncbi:MAG: HAMP domain-containing sensor histidine kinase [bacterium]